MSLRVPARALGGLILLLCVWLPATAATSWRWTPEVIVDQARATNPALSPDGTRIVYQLPRARGADQKGAHWSNLWVVPFSGGAPRRLTAADADDRLPAWSPDGTRLAFLSARGGESAKSRIWIISADGGEAQPITDESIAVDSFRWAPEGARIAFIAAEPKPEAQEKAEKAGRDWTVVDQDLRPKRIWVVEVPVVSVGAPSGPARAVESLGERSAWDFEWSPAGDRLVAAVSPTPRTDDSYVGKSLWILPLTPGRSGRELIGKVGKIDQVAWSPDGRFLAWRAGVDPSDPFSGSIFVAPADGSSPPVNLTGDRPESVNRIDWLRDGSLAFVVVTGTKSSIWSLDPARPDSRRPLAGPGAAVYQSASWSRDGRRVAASASTGAAPHEIHAGERDRKGGIAMKRITSSNSALEALPMGRQELFTYTAADGLDLEAVLIRPAEYPGRASYPLVVIVHGGPESQYLDGWNTAYATPGQALAERGCFVLYPNYRGSTGRGVAFSKRDHHDLGGREFLDVLDGIEALASRFPIDRKRVGIMGGSYGGYFTALGVTRHSERFAAGVELFGITNWISFIGTSDTPVENSQVHWDLWCYEHHDLCWKASPIASIDNARTPTLILQGEKDERVPKPQSDELYAALRWKGVPVEYVVFPRAKHGFTERAHQLEACRRILAWMEKHLGL